MRKLLELQSAKNPPSELRRRQRDDENIIFIELGYVQIRGQLPKTNVYLCYHQTQQKKMCI